MVKETHEGITTGVVDSSCSLWVPQEEDRSWQKTYDFLTQISPNLPCMNLTFSCPGLDVLDCLKTGIIECLSIESLRDNDNQQHSESDCKVGTLKHKFKILRSKLRGFGVLGFWGFGGQGFRV